MPSTLGQRSRPFLKDSPVPTAPAAKTRGPKELGPMFSKMRETGLILTDGRWALFGIVRST